MFKLKKYFCRRQNSGPCNNENIFSDNRGVSTTDLIITIVSVIVIIVSTVFLVMNVVNLKKVNSEIDEIKATIEAKQNTLNKLIELGQSEDVLKENYERNSMYIPDERDEVEITSDVTSIILEAEAIFRKITFEDEIPLENSIIDVPFIVRVECTYDILTEIIDKLGTTERLYVIESLAVVDQNTDSGNLSSDILMHAYYNTN